MLADGTCGGGAICERVCPLMKVGRICPTVLEGIAETIARGELTGTAPTLVRTRALALT